MSAINPGHYLYDNTDAQRFAQILGGTVWTVLTLEWDVTTRKCGEWAAGLHITRDSALEWYEREVRALVHAAVVMAAVTKEGHVIPLRECFSPQAAYRSAGGVYLYCWNDAMAIARDVCSMDEDLPTPTPPAERSIPGQRKIPTLVNINGVDVPTPLADETPEETAARSSAILAAMAAMRGRRGGK